MTDSSITLTGGISVPQAVADFYKENASAGTENLGGASMPTLKVVGANTDLPEGVSAGVGDFFLTSTQETFKELTVSVLTVSRSFYALGMATEGKKAEPRFTQLLGGIVLDTMQPFVLYVTGTKLNNLWEFAKEMSPFTKNKMSPIPMFAFQVKMTTEKVKTKFGSTYVIVFTIVKNDKGVAQLIVDPEKLQILRTSVTKCQELCEGVMEQREVDKGSGILLKDVPLSQQASLPIQEVVETDPEPAIDESIVPEDVSSEDIPF